MVTSKRQVTIPKPLADKKGIKPGDSVLFEESQEGILLRRADESRQIDVESLRKVIDGFMNDVPMIRKQLRKSKRALNENLSRHVSSK